MDANFRQAYIDSLEGTEIARMLSIALFSLTIYEYFITLDEEIKYFWKGRWTISRVLFLVNRYLSPSVIVWAVICHCIPKPSPEFCKPAIQVSLVFGNIGIGVVQAMLAARIWYLFQGSRTIQYSIVLGFVASLAASFVLLALSIENLQLISTEEIKLVFSDFQNVGCKAVRPPHIWRIFLPSLVLHTILYVLTAVRALRNRRLLKHAPIMKRLLRDGGFFYFVVFASVTLTTVFAFLTDYPKINVPAIYSNFVLAATSTAVSRVMLSIHSLAEKLGSDSAWLLTNAQLSRVGWRQGRHEGEIFVERDPAYLEFEMDSGLSRTTTGAQSFHSLLKETQVGVFNDNSW